MIPARCLGLLLVAFGPPGAVAADLTVNLRSRLEAFKGTGEWREVHLQQSLTAGKTAVLICDMWDKHWCTGATGRVNGLVAKMAPFVESARKRGIQIIHAPSETMDFYRDAPQRKRILAVPGIEPPTPLSLFDPPLPIDDTRGGCETPDRFYKAWTREHPGLRIDASDVISDNGTEIYSFLRERGIGTLLVMGVHTNMCVLNRTFAIKRMTALGIRCILVRDLTDAMYNPEDPPHVSHDAGTQLVIEYIEKYWCPTTTSADLLRAFAR
ncbi:MAG: isochorismatase family protein [Candidatus Sulfopaludibacter sp.]|nr:isochorismatase family protein [Candidatus Sulfopaludibacter sp.]